jgi:hypothetical protein
MLSNRTGNHNLLLHQLNPRSREGSDPGFIIMFPFLPYFYSSIETSRESLGKVSPETLLHKIITNV